jgi:tetratricopeptide (TPR) repeat protein
MRKLTVFLIIIFAAKLFCDLNFGKDLFDDGLFEEAIQEFEQVIINEPTSDAAARSLFYIGECYFAQNEFALAESSYKRLLSGYPNYSSKDKANYRLAVSLFEQQKYRNSISFFDSILDKYPLSQFSELSLEYILMAYYETEEYNDLIVKGRNFLKDYQKSKNLPDVMFWMAKAYFAVNIPDKGNELLERIDIEFTTSNANWKAVEFTTGLLEKSGKTDEAINVLNDKLTEDIPRQFEEKLKKKLAGYYLKSTQFTSANKVYDDLIKKFNNSENIDYYITKQAFCLLQIAQESRIISEKEAYKKVFKESDLKNEYNLYSATAFFRANQPEKVRNILENILNSNIKDEVFWKAKMLSAQIAEKSGKLNKAVSLYQEVLQSDYSGKDEILLALGDITFEKLTDFLSAKKYYQQILTNYSETNMRAKASHKISLCYEKLSDFESAIEELEQVNSETLRDGILKQKIGKKLKYLKRYKYKNYESAFNTLLESFYNFLETENKQKLKNNIAEIYSNDLKDLNKALSLVENNAEQSSLKAKILLQIAEKYKYENDKENAGNYAFKASSIILKLPESNQKAELLIYKDIVEAKELTESQIGKIKEFLKSGFTSSMRNEFILLVADFYEDTPEISAEYLEMLEMDDIIDEKDFGYSKIRLAEYYYNKDENEKALKAYKLVQSDVNLSTPKVLFHYAVILNETGNPSTSIEKFTFLLNNTDSFVGYVSAVNYFTQLLRDQNKFERAIQYQLLVPDDQRDDIFYQVLAEDYLKIGDKEKAKETLLYIQEKNEEILKKLALLQFETYDLEMAKYTYSELAKKNSKDLKITRMLAQISFIQEEFLDAAKYYKNIVDKLGDNFAENEHIAQIARENIIALYRIENRPKAQTLSKKFKAVLSLDDKNEIKLNEGIYYIEIDKKKAEGVFSKLLKDAALKKNVKIAAFFWRGVCSVEMKKNDEAEVDFETVANSIDETFSNQAHLKLGTLNFSNEKYDKALEHYYKVIENDEDGKLAFDAARNFAFVCKTIEEWQKAVSAYEIILERWGDDELESATMFDIAFCHFRDKKYANAIEMFQKAMPILESKELKAEAQYWIADSYFGLDEYEKSISEYLKVGYGYPEFPHWAASAELRAGEAYINLKDNVKARRTFERIIEKYGRSSNWGKEALKRLEVVN